MEEAKKLRADLLLVKKGLASSRTHAQALIDSQQVFLIGPDKTKKLLTKASQTLPPSVEFEIVDGDANRFVSRGGLKLEGALAHCKLNIESFHVLDVGISTGGFTDCVLQAGAEVVVGVDVGRGQVHADLIKDPRLRVYEGINARSLRAELEGVSQTLRDSFDLVVMDVSFISMTLILPELAFFLKSGGWFLGLVKPQFEVGVDGLGKGGIVKDASLYKQVEKKIKDCCQNNGLEVHDYFSSPIEGKDGNHEFFVFCKKP